MPESLKRLEIITACLVKMGILYHREMGEKELSVQSAIYSKALEDVPDVYLVETFDRATKTCRGFPRPAHLLEAWKDVDFGQIPEKTKHRPKEYTTEEHSQLDQLLRKYPRFKPFFDEFKPWINPDGFVTSDDMKKINKLMRSEFKNIY